MSRIRHIVAFTIGLVALLSWHVQAQPTTAPTPTTATAPVEREAASSAGQRAAVVVLTGEIDDSAARGLEKRFEEARALGADTVILKLNTPGGLVQSGLEISQFLKRQDDLHIIAYVERMAMSGGAMVAAAADEIVMEPNSQIGGSAVIAMSPGGGLQELGDVERAKFESPVLSDYRDSARENNHSALLLEAMVRVDKAVYWIQNTQTQERRLVDQAEYEKLIAPADDAEAQWAPVAGVSNPIDSKDELLMLTTDLAVKLGFARAEVASVPSFAAERGLTIVQTLQADTGEKIVAFLSSDIVRGLLMTVFMFSLYMAFGHPGTGGPEVIAVSSLAILLGVPALTGYAQWYEIVAVLLGVLLLAVELFVLPGFGIAGISGVVLILGGLTMTFVPPLHMPNMPMTQGLHVDWSAVANGFYVVVAGLAASLLLWVWLSRYLPKLPYANRLILQTTAGGAPMSADEMAAEAPEMPVVGEYGQALTDLRPGGMARFEGNSRVTDVVSDSGFVKSGTKLVVLEVAGSRVVVRPVASV